MKGSQKHSRPRIGVTGPSRSSLPAWYFIRLSVWLAGGSAVRITPCRPLPQVALQGLILGGGADIDPVRYKEKVIPTLKEASQQARHKNFDFFLIVFIWLSRKLFSLEFTTQREDKERDHLEFDLMNQAVQQKLPVLGICRGAQLINVFFGGTLHQDIAHFYVEQPILQTLLPKSTVLIEASSHLHSIMQRRYLRVNSLHHQAVKTLGHDLQITAFEPNGIIEAIEHTKLPFVVGVQWHPEFLLTFRRHRRLFNELVKYARQAKPLMLVPSQHQNVGIERPC
jgi:putative glutamine amidotransferase